MAIKKDQKKSWEDEFGACLMASGSMHQNIEECGCCEYCKHEGAEEEE
ncbi:MAG: hypothetical protein V1909_03110 [Candidatus Micrarchaeota archaeon]